MVMGHNNDKYTLLNEANIEKIVHFFEPLAKFVEVKKGKVSAIQAAAGVVKEYLKVGRPKWKLDDLLKLSVQHKAQYGESVFCYTHLRAEFPSIVVSYEQGTSPKMMIVIENDSPFGNALGSKTCAFSFSIREDVLEQVGKEAVHQFLRKICTFLTDTEIISARQYFYKGQDLLNSYLYKESPQRYKHWEKIAL
jgi:hypothetical protein